MAERAFVLLRMADVAPECRHPATGEGISSLFARLPRDHITRPLQETPGAGP